MTTPVVYYELFIIKWLHFRTTVKQIALGNGFKKRASLQIPVPFLHPPTPDDQLEKFMQTISVNGWIRRDSRSDRTSRLDPEFSQSLSINHRLALEGTIMMVVLEAEPQMLRLFSDWFSRCEQAGLIEIAKEDTEWYRRNHTPIPRRFVLKKQNKTAFKLPSSDGIHSGSDGEGKFVFSRLFLLSFYISSAFRTT